MTLVEAMTVAGLTVFLIFGVVSSAFFLNNASYEYQVNIELTNNARLVLDQLLWGAKQPGQTDRRGIIEAKSMTVSTNQIDFTDINGIVHSFRQNNGNIEYRYGAGSNWVTLFDPNGPLAFDPTQYSTNLSFSQTNPRAVQINLVLGKRLKNRWYYASISTQAAFRNA